MKKILCALMAALVLMVALVEGAEQKKAQPKAKTKSSSAKKAPSTRSILKGSKASQLRQNKQANTENLTRISEEDLAKFKSSGLLVRLPEGPHLKVDDRLDPSLRFCRPQTARFLTRTAGKHEVSPGKTVTVNIQVNSAIRTIERQKELRRSNPNAAKISGPTASSHLAGSTIDIAKIGMSSAELAWMRSYLARLERQGYIEATEEFRQLVFHVMVFKKYLTYGESVTPKKPALAKPSSSKKSLPPPKKKKR